ncbi:hypothetical protein BGZ60DRAFT_210207 [Tricladium varicosporioides]|nr:hypothetical protein BGZ60DRAFT_210207 [Hymenoscyphus varicosporioides]
MAPITTQSAPAAPSSTSKSVPTHSAQKRKPSPSSFTHRGHILRQTTVSRPPFTYVQLSLTTPPNSPSILDPLTARTYLTTALRQFLGISGEAVSVDILKIEGKELWVRVPREDAGAFCAAVGGWVSGGGGGENNVVGWRVVGRGNWLSGLVTGVGERGVWED